MVETENIIKYMIFFFIKMPPACKVNDYHLLVVMIGCVECVYIFVIIDNHARSVCQDDDQTQIDNITTYNTTTYTTRHGERL